MMPRPTRIACLASLLAAVSCEKFEAPPEVTIVGLKDGRLADAQAPLELAFSRPIQPSTLRLKIGKKQTDPEGILPDDNGGVAPEGFYFFTYPPPGESGGEALLLGDTGMRISFKSQPPVGPSLVLVVEPGLTGVNGVDVKTRRVTTFGYGASCRGNVSSGPFVSGQYFFLVDVIEPLGLQIQLLASIVVDPATGAMKAQFTNADRIADPSRCPTPCSDKEVCKLIPEPKCVAPSERASTVAEYPDFFANNQPPVGYTFFARGCAEEQTPGVVTFTNEPVDAQVQQPKVTIKNIVLSSSFSVDAQGQLRGTGTFTAEDVLLGTISSGAGQGNLNAVLIPADKALPDVPAPP